MRRKDPHPSHAGSRVVVHPAGRRGARRRSVVVAVSTWALLTACSGPSAGAVELPDRPADVQGTVAGEPGAPYLVETSAVEEGAWRGASGGYFERMSLGSGPAEGETVVVGDDDRALTVADLAAGDVVEVWIGEACGESSPVQCDVVAIRVAGRPG